MKNEIEEFLYDWTEEREVYLSTMREAGFSIILPLPNELQLDIDSEEGYNEFLSNLEILQRAHCTMDVAPVYIRREVPSKTGLPHRHITLVMPKELTEAERIAYQAVLGSDRKRELLSLIRLANDLEYPTLLTEKLEGPNGNP